MKFITKMPDSLKTFYQKELISARIALDVKNYAVSWYHLERAHILGQPFPLEHTYVHWKMLAFGIKLKNTKEILGQLPRLFFGGVKSFVGKIPIGNTGGSNVPPLKPMEIAAELKQIILENS